MKIGVVSNQTGLGIHTIRYYEKQGLIKKPNKDTSGHRMYTAMDVDILNWVACMKHSGMSLSAIKKYTKAFYNGDKATCTVLLEEHLQHLQHLQVQQAAINHYIDVTKNKIIRFKGA